MMVWLKRASGHGLLSPILGCGKNVLMLIWCSLRLCMTLGGGGRELTRLEVSQHPMVVAWEAAMFRDNGCLCGGIPHPPWQLLVLTRSTGSSPISVPSAVSRPGCKRGHRRCLEGETGPCQGLYSSEPWLWTCQGTDFLSGD